MADGVTKLDLAQTEARLLAHTEAMETRLLKHTEAMEIRLRATIESTEARLVSLLAAEVGSLHTAMQNGFARVDARMDAFEARQKREASMATTLMELFTEQTRWHEQSDNTIADLTARHGEFSRRLDQLGGKTAF